MQFAIERWEIWRCNFCSSRREDAPRWGVKTKDKKLLHCLIIGIGLPNKAFVICRLRCRQKRTFSEPKTSRIREFCKFVRTPALHLLSKPKTHRSDPACPLPDFRSTKACGVTCCEAPGQYLSINLIKEFDAKPSEANYAPNRFISAFHLQADITRNLLPNSRTCFRF